MTQTTHLVFKSTKLGIWYPTIDGRDVYRELSRKHGCSYLKADHPIFEDKEEAIEWGAERGYSVSFEVDTKAVEQDTAAYLDDL